MPTLANLVRRPWPEPWADGDDKIPWNDPEFSERMLREHLSQTHDAASRRTERVAAQVRWLFEQALNGRPGRVLDLACGPGLYTSQLADLGCACVGIDFSPAAIAHARAQAIQRRLDCDYQEEDVRTATYGGDFRLVMLIFGELNVFRPSDARLVLSKARAALSGDGRLVLEAHTEGAVRKMGAHRPSWQLVERGLFSDRPHLRLDESVWDEAHRVAKRRHFVVDVETAAVSVYGQSVQAYSDAEYRAMLDACGFAPIDVSEEWEGGVNSDEFLVMVATPI